MYICRVRLNPALLHTGKNSPAPCHLVPACNATAAPLVMQLECAHPRCTCTASPHARLHGKRLRAQLPERWPESAHMCDGQVDGPVCPCPMFVPDVRVRCAMARCSCPMFVPTCAMARCSCLVFVPGVRARCARPGAIFFFQVTICFLRNIFACQRVVQFFWKRILRFLIFCY